MMADVFRRIYRRASVRRLTRLLVALWLALTPSAAGAADVLVFAAASLKEALDEVATAWREQSGRTAVVSYAATPALARQIEQGAPAQLFISADREWMDYVAARKLIRPETRSDLLGNRLVLIAPKASTAATTIAPGFRLAELLAGGRLALADVNAVPAGKYAKAAFEHLGVWAAIERSVAQTENVRAALLLVSRGEAPLGVVYRTDAAADPNVRIVGLFPEDTHPPIIYPVALTIGAGSADAEPFLAYLRSSRARRMFEARGFAVLD
jgi:molybdate transport system substrate-binding protein